MKDCRQFFIDGKWVSSTKPHDFPVINPATEQPIATISLGTLHDVDNAVAAATKAFPSFSETTVPERLALLEKIIEIYKSKMDEMAQTISLEMGAPPWLAKAAQAPVGLAHLNEIVKVLASFKFEELKGSTLMRKEPIGVCGLITPWNWPMNQIVCKVAPALARWMHHGLETKRNCSALGVSLRANSRASRCAARSLQSGERRWPHRRCRHFFSSWHRHGFLHRIHQSWRRRGHRSSSYRKTRYARIGR